MFIPYLARDTNARTLTDFDRIASIALSQEVFPKPATPKIQFFQFLYGILKLRFQDINLIKYFTASL